MSQYTVFLSYARRDAKNNPWLHDFYQKLSDEAERKLGGPAFIDKEGIKVGDEWPDTLAEALQHCKAFICLYSRNYFKSENCGKEFEVFRQRVAAYVRTLKPGVGRPRLIIPVLWDMPELLPEPLPPPAAALQFTNAAFGDDYSRHGLEYIIRMELKQEYQRFIVALTLHLHGELQAHSLPPFPTRPSYATVESVFHQPGVPPPPPTDTPLDLPDTVPLPASAGLEATWFVYATGRKDEFQGVRQRLDGYGNDCREWRPYLPPSGARKVQSITTSVASQNDMVQDTLYLSKNFIEHLREAEKKNTPVVIIVDPWSLKAPSYRKELLNYDEVRLINCGVIVVWNEEDDETKGMRESLLGAIAATFSRGMDAEDTSFLVNVRNEMELREKVAAVIALAQERLKKRALRLRSDPPGDDESFPNI